MFAEEAIELMRDTEGGVCYYPARVPESLAAEWFSALFPLVPWHGDRRPMYARIVDVPRLMASVALSDPDRPPCIDAALSAVQAVAPAPYTHVGLNLYRDERDSVAMHNDRWHDLAVGRPISIFSLGAPRDMLIRPKQGGAGLRITLAPGSVLVMSHALQRSHDHGIPKCAHAAGPRISLAFRVRSSGRR